jgi:hypothetical protein
MHEAFVHGPDMGGVFGEGESGICPDGTLEIHQGLVFKALMILGKSHEILEFPGPGRLVLVEGTKDPQGLLVTAGVVQGESLGERGLACAGEPGGEDKKEGQKQESITKNPSHGFLSGIFLFEGGKFRFNIGRFPVELREGRIQV